MAAIAQSPRAGPPGRSPGNRHGYSVAQLAQILVEGQSRRRGRQACIAARGDLLRSGEQLAALRRRRLMAGRRRQTFLGKHRQKGRHITSRKPRRIDVVLRRDRQARMAQ